MKNIASNKAPNQREQTYWIDLKENPYGGIIKYYDEHLDGWVYLDEPLFQKSPANKLTHEHLDAIELSIENNQLLDGLQMQIDNLNEQKANIADVYVKKDIDDAHSIITQSINKNAGNIINLNNALSVKINEGDTKNENRIEQINGALSSEINSLKDAVQKGYDDTEIRNALAEKTSYTYVEQQIQNITGVAPTVLDTLEELANALGNDPNFAATVTQSIANRTTRQDVINIFNDMMTDAGLVETDPTVPQWAKQSTKPTYTASEVGALPSTTHIPNKTSDLTNDAGFVTRTIVTSMIQDNKELTTDQYTKINKIDSYQILNITESDVLITTDYSTMIINVPSTLDHVNIKFSKTPKEGSRTRLYINTKNKTSVNFYTLKNEILFDLNINTITRFDITAIDLTDYPIVTETGIQILSEGNNTIVVNLLDGYIIDYVGDNKLTWYEG